MEETLTISQARRGLTRLPRRFAKAKEPHAVTVTQRGKPVMAILSWDQYEGLIETMEILADAKLMARLRESMKQAKAGKVIPWEKIDAESER